MLSSIVNGYEKYPSYQMIRSYSTNNSLHYYNPNTQRDANKSNIESIKKVRAKTHLDLASKSPLIEDVNLVQERQEKDPFMSLAQNILQKDRVSLAEAAPPTGSGLTRRIPGIKQGKGKGGKTSSRKRTSLYDYLL